MIKNPGKTHVKIWKVWLPIMMLIFISFYLILVDSGTTENPKDPENIVTTIEEDNLSKIEEEEKVTTDIEAGTEEHLYVIDCLYYINLEKRKDRREGMEKVVRRFIDMGLLKPQKDTSAFRFEAIQAKDGNKPLACTRSHIGVHQKMIESGCKNGLILEDDWRFFQPNLSDATLQKRISDRHNMIAADNRFDVILFAANLHGGGPYYANIDPRYNTSDFLKVSFAQTASGYFVNGQYMQTLLDNLLECEAIVVNGSSCYNDVHWMTLMKRDNWYVFDSPKLGIQEPGYSDLQSSNVNYKVK